MSDYDYHCGECGAITICTTHDRFLADCSPRRSDCHEACSRDASHDVNKDD